MINIRSRNDYYKQLRAANDKVVVLEFYADWCSRCQNINKVVKSLARKYRNLVILKIDLDKFEYLAEKYNVESMPDFVFIQNKSALFHIRCADEETLTTMMTLFGK